MKKTAGLLMFALAAAMTYAQGIVNGSFNQDLDGWTTDGLVEAIEDPDTGNKYARVSDNPFPPGFSFMEQTFTMGANQPANLVCRGGFDMLGALVQPTGYLSVTFTNSAGTVVGLFEVQNTTGQNINLGAQRFDYTLGAANDTYKVRIFADPGTVTSIDVDNFTAEVVPEPGALAGMLTGALTLGAFFRRRQR